MVSKNNNKVKKTNGFTIVELLIVIVVIGILAAITIVAYNGVQNKAKAARAQSAAAGVVSKAELYNTDDSAPTSGYPSTLVALTGATSDKTFALTGVTLSATAITAAPADPTTVNFYTCGATVGNKVVYWDYGKASAVSIYSGSASATSTCTITAS